MGFYVKLAAVLLRDSLSALIQSNKVCNSLGIGRVRLEHDRVQGQ